jgi:hypothetical protein
VRPRLLPREEAGQRQLDPSARWRQPEAHIVARLGGVAGIHDAEEEADNGDREMGHVAGAKVGWQK